jgi:hypothetical protein
MAAKIDQNHFDWKQFLHKACHFDPTMTVFGSKYKRLQSPVETML